MCVLKWFKEESSWRVAGAWMALVARKDASVPAMMGRRRGTALVQPIGDRGHVRSK